MTVLKHLIHVFLLFGCLGFAFTIAHLMMEEWQGGPKYDPYEIEVAREARSIQQLVKYHPVVQGGRKIGQAAAKVGVLDAMDSFYKQFVDTRTEVMVHPLYVNLQQRSPLNMLLSQPFDINDHVYNMETNPIDGKKFYRKYMSKSLPCVFRREARDDGLYKNLSKATTKDQIDKILIDKFKFATYFFGQLSDEHMPSAPIKVTKISRAFGKKGQFHGQKSEQKNMKYEQFVESKKQFPEPDSLFFIEDSDTTFYRGSGMHPHNYDPLVNPIKDIMAYILQHVNNIYTQWVAFDGRKPHRLEFEQHVCVHHGKEQFRMVSPIYRKNLYVNVFDGYHNQTTPVDFFNVDLDKYPLTAQFNWIDVTLDAGDCMYIPAYYYVQSKTLGEGLHAETIMIAEQYSSHSKFVDVMMEALETEVITEKEKHQYEKAFDGAIEYLNSLKN